MKSAVKDLPPFDALTEAEARVFDDCAESLEFAADGDVPAEDFLLVVQAGALRLQVESGGSLRTLGTLERGGVVGEMRLFEPDTVPVLARAEGKTTCLRWTLPDLKSAFRYSRTGAVKLMAIFATSLSQKIRFANELLQNAPTSSGAAGARPRELGALDLQRLRSFAVSRDYSSGTRIFEEGDQGRELFVIGEGEVEILKKSDTGAAITLARLEAGDFFGEMAFVDGRPRSASAVARSDLHAYVLGADSLERIVSYNVGTALYVTNVLCKIMARRLDATLRRIASL